MSGTVYVWDGGLHARQVAASVRDTGVARPAVIPDDPVRHDRSIYDSKASSDTFTKTLQDDLLQVQIKALRDAAGVLRKLDKSNVHHSSINISKGTSEASQVKDLYGQMRLAWEPLDDRHDTSITQKNVEGKQLLHNYAKAKGLDMEAMLSSDPKISGPARGQLQESLIKTVHDTVSGNKDVAAAKKEYDTAVHDVEKNNNSVVTAAGNEGGLGSTFRKDAGESRARKVSSDFYANPFSNAETTTVGALKHGQVADYSTRSGAEVHANGDIRIDAPINLDDPNSQTMLTDAAGTSFAAPRVAAAMARLHQLHPDMSSQQIEDLLLREYTRSAPDGKKTVVALDQDKIAKAR